MKNWMELPVEELKDKKTKLFEFALANPTHEKAKEAWRAIYEIDKAIEDKETTRDDPWIGEVIQCLF